MIRKQVVLVVAILALALSRFTGCTWAQQGFPKALWTRNYDQVRELRLVPGDRGILVLGVDNLWAARRLWAVFVDRQGKETWRFNAGDDYIWGVDLSRDGSRVAFLTYPNPGIPPYVSRVFLLNSTGEEIWRYTYKGAPVDNLHLSPEGEYVAVSYSSDGDTLAGQTYPGRLVLLGPGGKEVWEKTLDLATFVGFPGPSGTVTLAGFEKYPGAGLVMYDGKGERQWKMANRPFRPLGLSADGRTVAALQGPDPREPDAPYGKLLWLTPLGGTRAYYPLQEKANLAGAVVSPDGEYVVLNIHRHDASEGKDKVLLVREDGKALWELFPEGVVKEVALSAEGHVVILTSRDLRHNAGHDLYLYDREGNLIWNYTYPAGITAIALGQDGRNLALAGGDGYIYYLETGVK